MFCGSILEKPPHDFRESSHKTDKFKVGNEMKSDQNVRCAFIGFDQSIHSFFITECGGVASERVTAFILSQ